MRRVAWIGLSEKAKLISCVLWDQSETGARIAAAHAGRLPDTFTLVIGDKRAEPRPCRVVWRTGTLLGVRFMEVGNDGEEPAARRPPPAPPQTGEAARPMPESLKQPAAVRYAARVSAAPSRSPISLMAIAFLLILIGLSVVFYLAGQQSAGGTAWALAVCHQADSMCQHPELSAGASVLMALVYFTTKGMEL